MTNVTYSSSINKAFQLTGGGDVILTNCNITGDVTGTYSASNIWCGDGRNVTVNGGTYGSIFINASNGAGVLSAGKITVNDGTIGKLILEAEKNTADLGLFGSGDKNLEFNTLYVSTAEELTAAIAAGKNVTFENDIEIAATNGGYRVAGIVVNGITVDGNGYTLTVTGAGGTWDCAIYTTGGTIKNLTVAGAMRGIFTAGASADIYIENVDFKNVVYTFNSDGGNKAYGVYLTNCTMNGWTSYSNVHKEVVFTDCTFTKGSGYAFFRPYNNTVLNNCVFTDGYSVDATRNNITVNDCYYGETLITAENAAEIGLFNSVDKLIFDAE